MWKGMSAGRVLVEVWYRVPKAAMATASASMAWAMACLTRMSSKTGVYSGRLRDYWLK